jgi:arylsulfatase A-like enzyme
MYGNSTKKKADYILSTKLYKGISILTDKMGRKQNILLLVVLLMNLFFISCKDIAKDKEVQHPNIVFILADDLGYGDLSCLNPESKIKTPHLDQLSKEGITFTDAHSGSAVCTPTRYGILTGRYAWRTRLKRGVLWHWDKPLIEPERLTIGDFLKEHGYSTACIGKWHLGWDWPLKDSTAVKEFSSIDGTSWGNENRLQIGKNVDFSLPIKNGPVTRGFDYYFGDDVPNFPPYCFIENDRTVGIPESTKPEGMFGTPGPMVEGWKLEDVMPAITEKAVAYIKNTESVFNRKEDAPFFLYFTLTAPHTPIAPADKFRDTSEAGAYGDYVQEVDWTVGQIVNALKEKGLEDNTLLIFTSDNGSPGRDGTNMSGPTQSVLKYGHDPSYHFRGMKADIWEGGHHVPFIVRWPGEINPGTQSDETICLTDFMATAAAIINEELPNNAAVDSYNLLPVLKGEIYNKPLREATVHHSGGGQFAIRQGKWKLILGGGSGGWTSPRNDSEAEKLGLPLIQLYDINEDIEEQNNLQEDYPEVVQKLEQLLNDYREKGRSAPKIN